MATRPLLAALLSALLLFATACGQDEASKAVTAALDKTITAFESGDLKVLWDISAPDAQKEIGELHNKLVDALAAVDTVYPPERREAARKALGAELVADLPLDAEDAGPKLLAKFIDPSSVRLDQEARDGLRTGGANIDGDKAVINTSAGESFTFQLVDGEWTSRLIMDLLEQNPRFNIMAENARQVLEMNQRYRDAWVESTDPKTPNGAYNLVRKAQSNKPPNAKMLFTMLDPPARTVILESLKAARTAQKAIQRRSSRAKRKALYKQHGILPYVKTTTDVDFYGKWAASPAFKGPLADDSPPDKVSMDPSNKKATVLTKTGQKVELTVGDDGFWHVSSHTEELKKALLAPFQQTLTKLSGG